MSHMINAYLGLTVHCYILSRDPLNSIKSTITQTVKMEYWNHLKGGGSDFENIITGEMSHILHKYSRNFYTQKAVILHKMS